MQNHSKIAFIGCGNMGTGLIKGLLKAGYPAQQIIGIESDETKVEPLKHDLGIEVYTDNHSVLLDCPIVVLSVKPQGLMQTLTAIDTFIAADTLVISIAAGITCSSIKKNLTKATAIIRVMPNTPSLINVGASGLYANEYVSAMQKEIAETMMNSVGISIWVDKESLIDVITAVSGSGPAYYFLFMEIFIKIAMKLGLDEEQSKHLVKQTALGAASMANSTEESVNQLRKNVTSPGGTTEAAINAMLDDNLEKLLHHALEKAEIRSKELANLFET